MRRDDIYLARNEINDQHDLEAYKTLMLRFERAGRCRHIRANTQLDVTPRPASSASPTDGGSKRRY
jgi:hypothetical protein